jgi:hypothetical protein
MNRFLKKPISSNSLSDNPKHGSRTEIYHDLGQHHFPPAKSSRLVRGPVCNLFIHIQVCSSHEFVCLPVLNLFRVRPGDFCQKNRVRKIGLRRAEKFIELCSNCDWVVCAAHKAVCPAGKRPAVGIDCCPRSHIRRCLMATSAVQARK